MKKTQKRIIKAVLADLANGMTMKTIAAKYGVTQGTVSKWKAKYGLISPNEEYEVAVANIYILF